MLYEAVAVAGLVGIATKRKTDVNKTSVIGSAIILPVIEEIAKDKAKRKGALWHFIFTLNSFEIISNCCTKEKVKYFGFKNLLKGRLIVATVLHGVTGILHKRNGGVAALIYHMAWNTCGLTVPKFQKLILGKEEQQVKDEMRKERYGKSPYRSLF